MSSTVRPFVFPRLLGILAATLVLAAASAPARAQSTVSGEGYGVSLTAVGTTITQFPHAVLDPNGGLASANAAGVDAPGLLSAGTLAVTTQGTTTPTTADAETTSTVQQVNVLNGLVTADVVTAQSSSTCDGASASSSDAGTTLANLVVAGVPINATPPPNTIIPVPFGTVTLNEQITGGNGQDTSSLTVNLIHVRLTLPVLGDVDVVVASAHSDVDCAGPAGPTPTPTPVVAPCPPATPTATATPGGDPIVSGEAFGVFVDLLGTQIPRNPHVILAPAGGSLSSSVASLAVPGVLSTGTLTASTNGATAPTTASSDARATVENASVLNGLVTATLLQSMSNSACDGTTATSTAAGTQFVGLVVNGIPIAFTPPANTAIVVPGIATIVLNEQIPGGDGNDTSSLTVNAVHITLLNGTGEIILASAHSDVDCSPDGAPGPTPATPVATCTPVPTATATGPIPTTTPPGATATATAPTPQATPDLNHFLCYEIHRAPARRTGVTLDDRYGASTVDLKRMKRLCMPADKNDEDPTAPGDPEHLAGYTIKQTFPRFTRVRDQVVTNQFGTLVVDLTRADRLLVPAAKNLAGLPPEPNFTTLDHFKCYRIGNAKFRAFGIKTDDQLMTQRLDIKRPHTLCVAADKNDEGIPVAGQALTCYQVRPAPGSPPPAAALPDLVFINHQFGPDSFGILGPRELCVPSTIAPSP